MFGLDTDETQTGSVEDEHGEQVLHQLRDSVFPQISGSVLFPLRRHLSCLRQLLGYRGRLARAFQGTRGPLRMRQT